MFRPYLKFEFMKRHAHWWLWLLVAVLTGLGIAGNFQQKQAQEAFVQRYRQVLIKNKATKADGPQELKAELKKLSDSPAAYNAWFNADLLVALGEKQGRTTNNGGNFRLAALNGGNIPYKDAISRTFQQNRLLARKKLTGYYPQSLLFTDEELQAMSNSNLKIVNDWFPTFYIRGFDYLQYLFQQNIPFYLLLISIVVSGSFFAKELVDKRGHANWLILPGESLSKQIGVQFLTIVITMIEIVFLPLFFTTLAVGLFRGFGSLQFPILQNTSQELVGFVAHFTTNGLMILKASALLLLLIGFVASLNLLTAIILKNSWLTTLVVLLLTAGGLLAPPIDWWVFSFFNVWGIVTGRLAQTAELPTLELWPVAGVVVLWTLLFLLAALFWALSAGKLVQVKKLNQLLSNA